MGPRLRPQQAKRPETVARRARRPIFVCAANGRLPDLAALISSAISDTGDFHYKNNYLRPILLRLPAFYSDDAELVRTAPARFVTPAGNPCWSEDQRC